MSNSLPCSRAMSIALTKARAEAAEKSVGCRMGRSRLDRLTRQSRGSRFLEEVAHRPKDIDVAEDPDQLSGVGPNDRNGADLVFHQQLDHLAQIALRLDADHVRAHELHHRCPESLANRLGSLESHQPD